MKGDVYILINEGAIIVASNNKEYIEDNKETRSEEAMADTAENWGRFVDTVLLSPRSIVLAFNSGIFVTELRSGPFTTA